MKNKEIGHVFDYKLSITNSHHPRVACGMLCCDPTTDTSQWVSGGVIPQEEMDKFNQNLGGLVRRLKAARAVLRHELKQLFKSTEWDRYDYDRCALKSDNDEYCLVLVDDGTAQGGVEFIKYSKIQDSGYIRIKGVSVYD
jgi:hypothetical protein